MPGFGSADVVAAVSGPDSVAVLWGTVTTRGLLEQREVWEPDDYEGGQRVRQATVLTTATGTLPDVGADDRLVVDGVPYVVHGALLVDDGAITLLTLARDQ